MSKAKCKSNERVRSGKWVLKLFLYNNITSPELTKNCTCVGSKKWRCGQWKLKQEIPLSRFELTLPTPLPCSPDTIVLTCKSGEKITRLQILTSLNAILKPSRSISFFARDWNKHGKGLGTRTFRKISEGEELVEIFVLLLRKLCA